MDARDFGFAIEAAKSAEEDVRLARGMSPRERYERYLELLTFFERIWVSLPAAQRARYERVQREQDDPGRWWERVPRR